MSCQGESLEQLEAARKDNESQLNQVQQDVRNAALHDGLRAKELEQVALRGENIFEELMNTVRVATLGQITQRLYRVGGRYRRNL